MNFHVRLRLLLRLIPAISDVVIDSKSHMRLGDIVSIHQSLSMVRIRVSESECIDLPESRLTIAGTGGIVNCWFMERTEVKP